MNKLKYSKSTSKLSKAKISNTLNASDAFVKLASNDFYRTSKYINDSSHFENSIEIDMDDQVPNAKVTKNNESISQGIANQKQLKQPRNFSLPDISRIQHMSTDKSHIPDKALESIKKAPVSQSISDHNHLNSFNELASTYRRSSIMNSRVLNPSLTSLHPKEETSPQQFRALEKLVVTKGKMERKRKQSQQGVLVKRDISHLNNSVSRQNPNSVIFIESQSETPKPKAHKLFNVQAQAGSGGQVWTSTELEKENQQGRVTRQTASISEIGGSMPVSQSVEKILVRRNTKQEIEPIVTFLDRLKNESEEKSSAKREKSKARMNYKTQRRSVSDLHLALSSARKQLKDQESVIAEENENTNLEKTQETEIQADNSASHKFYKLFDNTPAEKLNPNDYLLHSAKKLTGLGTSSGPSVPKVMGISGNVCDNDEKGKAEIIGLIADLKKYVPTALSGAPPSRQDAVGLSQWIEGKVESVVKGSEDDVQKLWKCDTIYNLGVNEIIRQVSIDCGERGEALYQIWWNYLKMFAQFKQRVHIENEKIKENCQKESQKQQQVFQEITTKKDSEIERLKAEVLRLEGEKNEIQTNFDQAVSKKTKYQQKVNDLKRLLDRTKEMIQELRNENEAYVRRLNKRLGPNGKPGHVPLYLAHHKQSKEDEGSVGLRSDRDNQLTSNRREAEEKTAKIEGLESESSESEESSEEFAYEDFKVNNRQTYINNNVLAFRGADKAIGEAEGIVDNILPESREIEVQTDLQLVEGKYNDILENQKTLEELLAELKLKQQVGDLLNEAENIPGVDGDLKERTMKKSFSWYSLSHKSLVEDRIDGIGKFSIEKEKEKKKSRKHRSSFRSAKALLGVSRCSSIQNSEPNSPSSKRVKSVTDMCTLNTVEDERSQREGLVHTETSITSGEGREVKEMKIPNLREFPSIEEQEEGKSTQRSQRLDTGLNLKPLKPNYEDLEEVKGDGKTSESHSVTQDAYGNASIDEGLQEEENRNVRMEKMSEKEFPETPIRKKIPSFSRDFNCESGTVSPRSYATDDLFNLEDSDSDAETNDEVENERRDSMAIIEEAAEEDRGSPYRKYSRRRGNEEGEEDEHREINMESVEMENKEPKLSMATIVKLKLKARNAVNNLRQEDNGVVDKAKLVTVIRLYRVEKEKNVILQNTISDLEEQLVNEKRNISKGEEAINDLRLHIKMLENLKEICPHGKCPTCIEEQNAELKAQEGDLETFAQETSSAWFANIESRSMLGSRRDVDSEVDEGSEMSRVDSRIRRTKRLMKTTWMSQQSELSKKKSREQKENFVSSVIGKVKEKKVGKLKNIISVSGVLRQMSCLYGDRIAQGNLNAAVKQEPFAVFVYRWFVRNFVPKKIAEQKFVTFALSVKKHMHVVRINIFARFIGILEGAENYSLDELNKYLEGVDFINNNTLGTNIVNQNTDSKHYVPYLRGLEYISSFAENKMPLGEYTEFRQEFESLKETDPKNINKNGIIDIDLLMTKILKKYRIVCNRNKQFVINAFKALDFDNNKHCSLKEFIMIYRYIEPQKFDCGAAENLFYEKSDAKIDGELSLSFDKFANICVEYGLFSDAQQDLFLGVEAKSVEDQAGALQDCWEMSYEKMSEMIKGINKMLESEKEYWLDVLESLQKQISKGNELSKENLKSMLMAHKMFELEIQRLSGVEKEREDI